MIPDSVKASISKALFLLPPAMTSPEARVMLFAIGLQESRFIHRDQVDKPGRYIKGPALGFWQFERMGGCKGVVTHAASRYWMAHLCKTRGVDFTATAVWNAVEHDDVLAAGAARLLLFTDPKNLPALGEDNTAWNYYLRGWRPGAWDRGTTAQRAELRAKWSRNYAEAQGAL